MIKGMCKTYSRCGKTCDERFNNVKDDRALMLLGETTKQNPSIHTMESKDRGSIQDALKSIESHRDRLLTANSSKTSPTFLAQGRDEYYNSVRNHDKVPPCGYYNLENQQLKYCKSIPNFNKKHKSKSKVPKEIIDVPYRTVEKLNKRTPSASLFKLQLPRQGLEKMCKDVNEKRFETKNPEPLIYSKTKKIISPDFLLGTGHNLSLPESKNSAIYNPNFEFI